MPDQNHEHQSDHWQKLAERLDPIPPEEIFVLKTSTGEVIIQTRADLAKKHVERITILVREKFYDGLIFHRVIEDFMAQTGDPTGTGTGGSGVGLKAEFSSSKHKRGAVSMARAQDPDSADSQFFIVTADCPWLDNSYTIWGTVLFGMEAIDQLQRGEPPGNPDQIETMRVLSDLQDV